MSSHQKFGVDNYYSSEPGADPSAYDEESKKSAYTATKRVLDSIEPNARLKVKRVKDQWNSRIREALRVETGFRLGSEESRKYVPILISDSLPAPFADIINREGLALASLRIHLKDFQITEESLAFLVRNFEKIEEMRSDNGQSITADANSIQECHDYIDSLNSWLKDDPFWDSLKVINQDVLGAYFFRHPKIEVYWVVIGVIARSLGVSIESLAFVVLTHELAHAYTHLGQDIDHQDWGTADFANTDIEIVEGLAQFYTKRICERHGQRFPEALKAYEALLEIQPPAYCVQEDWEPEQVDPGEIIRAAMLKCRSTGELKYENFEASFANLRNALRSKSGGQPQK